MEKIGILRPQPLALPAPIQGHEEACGKDSAVNCPTEAHSEENTNEEDNGGGEGLSFADSGLPTPKRCA